MNEQERKAVRLVTEQKVTVHAAVLGDMGVLAYAEGTVVGDSGSYFVTYDHGTPACNCPYGTNQPGRSHSHTIALYMAATRRLEKELNL